MRQPYRFIAVAPLLAAIVAVSSALAQQGSVTSSRLMFDPSELPGSESRKWKPADSAPTTGQNIAPQPRTTGQSSVPQPAASAAARRAAAPRQPTAPTAPTAKPLAAPKPPSRATASAPARPAAARRPAPADNAENRAANTNPRSADRPIPREQPPALGRIALPSGSLGYESKTQMQAYDMSDGNRVPGYDNIQRNQSSYFGLSLRMPTSGLSVSPLRSHGAE